jgi:hypothetical protein
LHRGDVLKPTEIQDGLGNAFAAICLRKDFSAQVYDVGEVQVIPAEGTIVYSIGSKRKSFQQIPL